MPRKRGFREPGWVAQRQSGKTRIQIQPSLASEPMFIPCMTLSLAMSEVYVDTVCESGIRFLKYHFIWYHFQKQCKLDHDQWCTWQYSQGSRKSVIGFWGDQGGFLEEGGFQMGERGWIWADRGRRRRQAPCSSPLWKPRFATKMGQIIPFSRADPLFGVA